MKAFIMLLGAGTLVGVLSNQERSAIGSGLLELEQTKEIFPGKKVSKLYDGDELRRDETYNSHEDWRSYVNSPCALFSTKNDKNVRQAFVEEQISKLQSIEELEICLEEVEFEYEKERLVTTEALSQLRIYCHHITKLADDKFPGCSARVLELFPKKKTLVRPSSENTCILFSWLGRLASWRDSSTHVTEEQVLSKNKLIKGLREYFQKTAKLPLKKAKNWKVKLEKLVLGLVNQIYRFQLIEKSEMQEFFWSPPIVYLTGRHIAKLFPRGMGLDVKQKYFFQPELNYLTLIGPTRHLCHCLADLENDQQRHIIHAAWSVSYVISSHVGNWYPPQFELKRFTSILTNEDFLVKLHFWEHGWPYWAKKKFPSEDRALGIIIGILVENFRRPVIHRKKISLRKLEEEDYLLNFFNLHYIFINLDEPSSLQRLLTAEENAYPEFSLMINFLSCGKLLYEWIEYGLKPLKHKTPEKRKRMQLPQSPEESQLIMRIIGLKKSYLELEAKIEKRASESKDVQAWKDHPAVSSLIWSFSRAARSFHTVT